MHCRSHHSALQELRFDPRTGGRRRAGEPDSGHKRPELSFKATTAATTTTTTK